MDSILLATHGITTAFYSVHVDKFIAKISRYSIQWGLEYTDYISA